MTAAPQVEQVRLKTFPDGTTLVCVTGCPNCGRWTRTTAFEPRRYPYHKSECEWSWEKMPPRVAHVDPAVEGVPAGSPRILQVLPENADWERWEP